MSSLSLLNLLNSESTLSKITHQLVIQVLFFVSVVAFVVIYYYFLLTTPADNPQYEGCCNGKEINNNNT